MQEYRNFETCV